MLTRLDRYIAKLIFVPLLATLTIAAMLLLLENMLRLFDFVIQEGGPVSVVWRMLGNMIPQYLGLGIPIGLFVGILLAFRRLAMQSELDAMLSSGVSYLRMLRTPFIYATALAAATLAIVGFIQPVSIYNYEGLRFELRSGALGASVKVGEFAQFGDGMTLRVEESRAQGQDLRGIFAQVNTRTGDSLAISASRGAFLRTDDPDKILFRLQQGLLVHTSERQQTPRVLSFQVHDLPIDLPRMEAFRQRGGEQEEMTLNELLEVESNPGLNAAAKNMAIANFHRRVIQAVILFVIPFLAIALAVPPKRSTSSIGMFVGIVMLVSLHKILEALERAAGPDGWPTYSPWLAFAVFVGLSMWMFHTLAYTVGGQPLGALTRFFTSLGSTLAKLLKPVRRLIGLAPARPAGA
jgi:lipopolysaccharide export system permease protein